MSGKKIYALVCVLAAIVAGASQARPLEVSARPLSLDGAWRETARADGARLEPVGGLRLSARDDAFGGLSGLILEGETARFVSDAGHWVTLKLERDGAGRILGVAEAEIRPILDNGGKPTRGGRRDAESLARAPDGRVWVGFERADRIVAYDAPDQPPVAGATQLPIKGIEYNKGIEALAALPGGALLAIAEAPPAGAAALTGWRLAGGLARPFTIERRDDFSATGADVGPDGALYLVERRFGVLIGQHMRIRRFPDIARRLAAGDGVALGHGETLITLDGAAPIDNMEAIAVEPMPGGGLLLTVASDDNFNFLQNTVLLQFVFAP